MNDQPKLETASIPSALLWCHRDDSTFLQAITDDVIDEGRRQEPLFITRDLAYLCDANELGDFYTDAEKQIIALFASGYGYEDRTLVALYNACVGATDRFVTTYLESHGVDWRSLRVA